ncbi:serine/threonine-protein phosphatase 6 regulatory ankyrin repeat subunit B-like [Haliotis asinina]|uniref:serine/threonine-protein phosphatase 6 regulatory ankyrin repeat subunit B-like n=1 Tax=Haliotis asinina TaxID=109174 RepID=UPI00353217CA
MQNYPEKAPQHQAALLESLVNNPLHDACRKGDPSRVRRILSQGLIDVNRREKKYGRTPLMVAAYNGHKTAFGILMKNGANTSYVDNNGNNVLQWACMGGHVAIVRYVLKRYSIAINCRAHYGETPLMNAVYYGHKRVFAFLMSMGANLSLVDKGGDNILHWACMGGHVAMVEYVLSKYRFDVNNRGKSGSTPLMTAATYGHRDVFDFLRCMGANVLQVDDEGNNILHWTCSGGIVGMVKHVIAQHLFDINSKTKTGKTPLMTAVYYGYKAVFDVLVSEGANESQMDGEGDNILHYASLGGQTEMIQYIISQNLVDINSRGRYERTPLMRAAYYGHRKAFEILVKRGGLTQLVDDKDYNILHLASLGGHVEMVMYILSQNMINNSRHRMTSGSQTFGSFSTSLESDVPEARLPDITDANNFMPATSEDELNQLEKLLKTSSKLASCLETSNTDGRGLVTTSVYSDISSASLPAVPDVTTSVDDVELATWKAVLGNIRIHGCLFHLTQAKCRKCQEPGLQVSTGSCVARNCSLGQRCLKSRSGKVVCVKDEKQIHHEESHKRNLDGLVTSVANHLYDACKKGDLGRVKRILCRELVEVDIKDKRYGKTALMVAAQNGDTKMVDFLVSVGANLSEVDNDGDTILHWACRGGHVDMVMHLVSVYSVDVNRKAKRGKVPLMTAAYHGHSKMVDFLVSVGANLSEVDDEGDSIFHWACKGGHVDMVKHLVSEYSVDVNRKSKIREIPLMTAAFFGHPGVFHFLVSEGANVSQIDDDGDNILDHGTIGGHVKMIQYILSNYMVDVNRRGRYGRTPLMRAAQYGHKKVFETLLKKGGLTRLVDNKGRTILHLACLGGHMEIVKCILSQNMVDVNARDHFWNTAAMTAKRNGQLDVYNLLLSWG